MSNHHIIRRIVIDLSNHDIQDADARDFLAWESPLGELLHRSPLFCIPPNCNECTMQLREFSWQLAMCNKMHAMHNKIWGWESFFWVRCTEIRLFQFHLPKMSRSHLLPHICIQRRSPGKEGVPTGQGFCFCPRLTKDFLVSSPTYLLCLSAAAL